MASSKARKLQGLREARGLSPDEAASRLGVATDAVWAWERGEAEPDPETERRIADFYGVSQDDLRHEEDQRHHPNRDRA